MKTRIIKLRNEKFVLEARRFFVWKGVDRNGMIETRTILFGLFRNPCWHYCWCDTKDEAEKRKPNLLSY